jgi:hypothetical protein
MDEKEKELVDDLKHRLRITWDDEDEYLRRLIDGSMAYLSDLAGTSFDFFNEGPPKQLMLERCRYVYNNATDEFEINFNHELKRLILNVALGKSW